MDVWGSNESYESAMRGWLDFSSGSGVDTQEAAKLQRREILQGLRNLGNHISNTICG